MLAPLSRKQTFYLGLAYTGTIMAVRNFFPWYETILDGTGRMQCTVVFMRTWMLLANYVDAEYLDDAEKSKHVFRRERKYAEYLRQIPSFADYFHYHMFLPLCFIGDCYEFGTFIDFINMRGDIAKMKLFSNLGAFLLRYIEHLLCWYLFYQLGLIADPLKMAEPSFLEHPLWYRSVYMLLAANSRIYFLFARFSYHEVGMIGSGISYQAETEKSGE